MRNQTPLVGSPEPVSKDGEERSSLGSSPFGTKTQGEKESSTPNKSGFLFASARGASLTSQSVDTSSLGSSPFGQTTQGESQRISSTGSHLFLSQNGNNKDESGDGDHEGPDFEPIIPLPDKINVKTGEEDEEVIFSHRAKLYRFVAEDKQWKERGVGDIKLLKNRQTGKMRVLMRRDQVLKICANHQITGDMKLQPNAGSDTSWVWSTMADFSEQECRAEQLAVKFKSEDIAKQFKKKFEECQEMLQNQTPLKPQEEQKDEKAKEDLMAKFKPAERSWECNICMVNNDSDKVECAACGSLKPGAEPHQAQKKDDKPLFSFGTGASSSGGGFSFGTGASSSAGGFSFGTGASSSGGGCSFGTGASSSGGGVSFVSSGASQGIANQGFTLGSFSQTSSSSSGFPFRFGSLKQVGNIRERSEETTNVVVQTDEVKEDLMTKPAEVSWECNICMANNDRDKVECAACGSVKLGAEPNHGQKKEPKSLFSFGSGASSSGGGFVFGSGGTSQGDTKPVFNLSSGFPFSFGSLKQGGGVSEQQTEDTQKRVPSLHERTPNKEADNTKDYSKCQEMLKNQTSVKQTQQEKKHKEAKEDLIAKFKPSEGSWEGNICMVNNDSDKVECEASGSLKLGAEPHQGQKKDVKPLFSFGTGASSSGGGFSFGTSASSSGGGFSVGTSASSSGGGFSFGTGASSSGGGFSLGTRASSSGGGFTFGTGASSSGGGFSLGTRASSSGGGFTFGTGASSSGGGFSLGTRASSSGGGFTFGTGASSSGGGFSLGTRASSSGGGFTFGTGASSSGGGFSLGTRASSSGGGFTFGTGASSSGGGFSLGTRASSSGGGFTFRTGASSSGGGFSFGTGASSSGEVFHLFPVEQVKALPTKVSPLVVSAKHPVQAQDFHSALAP